MNGRPKGLAIPEGEQARQPTAGITATICIIAYARWMQGRKSGIKAADDLAAAMAPFVTAMPEMADAFLTMPLFARARLGAWDEVLKTPRPKDTMPAQTAIWHYARVLALAARGDQAAAVQEQAAFDAARAKLPADRPWGNNKSGT
jgi:hypothetical protein